MFGLASCQPTLDIEVISRNGQLVFTLKPPVFQRWMPRIAGLEVDAVSKPSIVMWRVETSTDRAVPAPGEIVFGHVPPGMKQTSEQKPLMIGQLYRVTLDPWTMGTRSFLITDYDISGKLDVMPEWNFHH